MEHPLIKLNVDGIECQPVLIVSIVQTRESIRIAEEIEAKLNEIVVVSGDGVNPPVRDGGHPATPIRIFSPRIPSLVAQVEILGEKTLIGLKRFGWRVSG